jgi:hypothetical protein
MAGLGRLFIRLRCAATPYGKTLCVMPMRKILLTITGIFIWTSGQTCDCDYIGNFLTTSKWAELIFIVKVKGHGDYISLTGAAPTTVSVPLTATFEIVKTLKGTTDKKEIRVFGDNGVLFRPYIDTFQKKQVLCCGFISM